MSQAPSALNKDTFKPRPMYNATDGVTPRPAKRARVALACQRCKLRKQKCDGAHPSCSKCQDLGATCEYIIPSKPMPFGKNHYLKALEERVAELESYLTKEGREDVGSDHWQYLPRPTWSKNGIPEFENRKSRRNQSRTVAIQAEASSSSEELEEEDDRGIEVDTMIGVLRDLSLDANGGYMGATAHITIGRLVGSIVKGKNSRRVSSDISSVKEHLSQSPATDDDYESADSAFTRIPAHVADRMLLGYIKHISTEFPILHSPKIRDLHSRRNTLDKISEICILHLIYAIGGRFLETTGEQQGCFFPERHHAAALQLLDEILHFHDSTSVQALMLLAIYCLRAPQGPGAWTYVGLAMRIAIDLGLHRRTSAMSRPSLDNELRKRLFWSCYSLDRRVSIPLGRPFAISDREIDIPLPLDVDEATEDVTVLEETSKIHSTTAPTTSTTLSLFIQVIRLRMIESSIQQKVYRVDSAVEASDAEIDGFSSQLAAWKTMIPLDVPTKLGSDLGPSARYEHYMVHYYKALRLLLYPQVSRPHVNPRYLKECAEACGGVCRTYKELHQNMPVGYSLMALQSVFMAGLTLIYCTWVDPALIFNSVISNDINACSIVLFVITERWPGARKYRNAFEAIKQNVIDLIAEGKHLGPRQAIVQLKDGLQSTLHNMQGDEDQQDECSRILTDMAGERIAVEQGALLPQYGLSSQEASMSAYQEMGFDDQFPSGNLLSDEFDMGNLSALSEWR